MPMIIVVAGAVIFAFTVVAIPLSPLGAQVSLHLDRTLLPWLFVGFLLFAAAMMLLYTPRSRDTLGNTTALTTAGMGVGGAAGFIGGLLGVGGGNIIVPALVALCPAELLRDLSGAIRAVLPEASLRTGRRRRARYERLAAEQSG